MVVGKINQEGKPAEDSPTAIEFVSFEGHHPLAFEYEMSADRAAEFEERLAHPESQLLRAVPGSRPHSWMQATSF